MYTARSLRRLKPDPVPDELIMQVLDAAICDRWGRNMARVSAPCDDTAEFAWTIAHAPPLDGEMAFTVYSLGRSC
jgi:hypothetical protein